MTSKDIYACDGIAFEFAITFPVDRVADVYAFTTRDSDGAVTELIPDQDYVIDTSTWTLVTRVDDNSDPIPAGQTLTITRQTPILQPSGRSSMSARVFRTRTESLTRIFQELREQLDRTLHIGQDYPPYFRNTDVYLIAEPTLISSDPSFVAAGGGNVEISVTGTNFEFGAVFRVNGVDRSTTVLNHTTLLSTIAAADVADAGTLELTVFNPMSGLATNALQFDVLAFPFRYFALRSTGVINTSDDAETWSAGTTITGAAATWTAGGYSPLLHRFLAVSFQGPADTILTAWTDNGTTWTRQNSSAIGKPVNSTPVKVIWTDLWGGRFYVSVRDSGANLGDVYYSDDGGDTWTAMTWPASKSGSWDVEYMAIGPDRIVVVGRFLADSNSQKRMFYSTDGDSMVAGPTFTSTGMLQSGDGVSRGACYSPDLDRYIFVGASISNGIAPTFVTTQDGTALSVSPSSTGAAGSSRASDTLWVASFTLALSSWSAQGTTPTTAFPRSATATASSWTNIPESGGFTPRAWLLAYSPSQDRVVAANDIGGFTYTDDGVNYNLSSATTANNWRSVVATR
jgi:hypothetical protein